MGILRRFIFGGRGGRWRLVGLCSLGFCFLILVILFALKILKSWRGNYCQKFKERLERKMSI
jgi:uncharacterized SAM-binding protein YcdF (DUF218 family)